MHSLINKKYHNVIKGSKFVEHNQILKSYDLRTIYIKRPFGHSAQNLLQHISNYRTKKCHIYHNKLERL